MAIKPPSKATLNKYGLDVKSWKTLLLSQGSVCGACGKVPSTGRLVIDHEHVKNWKKKPKEERVKYVRGCLCWVCNHYRLGKGATVANLLGASEYLKRYDKKKQEMDQCHSCRGKGKLLDTGPYGYGPRTWEPCDVCNGTGKK